MPAKPFSPKELEDFLGNFLKGMDGNRPVTDLESNQSAYLENATVTNGYAAPRPAFRKIALSTDDAALVASLNWQGAGYFKADNGSGSLIAQMAGRLFTFAISGDTAAVSEFTISGDPNSAGAPIAWIWQSEAWAIISDGQRLPIFWDGGVARRSTGSANQVGTVRVNFTAPAIGQNVTVTTNATFTGPFNAVVSVVQTFGAPATFLFQTIATPTTDPTVTLQRRYGPSSLSANEVLYNRPNWYAKKVGTQDYTATPGGNTDISIALDLLTYRPTTVTIPARLGPGNGYDWFVNCQVLDVLPGYGLSVRVPPLPSGFTVFSILDQFIIQDPNAGPQSVAGVVKSPVTLADSPTQVALLNPYVGIVPAQCWFDPDNNGITATHVTVTGAVRPPPSNAVVLRNINAPAGTVFTGIVSADPAAAPAITTIAELPICRMGVYGLGRNWVSGQDGRTFFAGDIVGGSSGTQPYAFRDAVLKMNENTQLATGGSFVVPGQVGDIRAMIFAATLDKSLGQGPLQVLTPTIAFSCDAPVDRATWQTVTNPILTESLIGAGALSQNATVSSNSDTIFRSILGISSLTLARRDFGVWGNVPISTEVNSVILPDNEPLLQFSSAIVFDNRVLMTAGPVQSGLGVYFSKLTALNNNPISSLQGKAPSVYDGIWTGLNILQLVAGNFNGTTRAFAFCLNIAANTVELWEILPLSDRGELDDSSGQIRMEIQSPGLMFGQRDSRTRDYKQLMNGEIGVDDLIGLVTFQVYYRADQNPNWTLWHQWTEQSTGPDPEWRPRMGLGEPAAVPIDGDNPLQQRTRDGYFYQAKIVITGHCRFTYGRFMAVSQPQPQYAPPKTT